MALLPIETRKLYKQIRQDVISLHHRWSIARKLYFESQENTDLLKQTAPLLFDRVLYNDMLDAMVLDLARLLDPAEQGKRVKRINASLEKLIKEVEEIQPTLAKELETHRNNVIHALPTLDTWRNKWAAHRDYAAMLAMQTPSLSALRPTLNRKQIDSALAELDLFMIAFQSVFHEKQIVNPSPNDVIAMIDAPDPYNVFDATDETEKLLKIIRAGVETLTDS
jgi:hypothetical protein